MVDQVQEPGAFHFGGQGGGPPDALLGRSFLERGFGHALATILASSCSKVRSQRATGDGRGHAQVDRSTNGHLRRGSGRCGGRRGKRIFPSLHEEAMPPKSECTLVDSLSGSSYDPVANFCRN